MARRYKIISATATASSDIPFTTYLTRRVLAEAWKESGEHEWTGRGRPTLYALAPTAQYKSSCLAAFKERSNGGKPLVSSVVYRAAARLPGCRAYARCRGQRARCRRRS